MYTLKRMVPYFFAAGDRNYASIYWKSSTLPEPMLTAFLWGEHVVVIKPGFGILFFMTSLESKYIRYGKSRGGLVGKSLSPEQVSEWIFSSSLQYSLY